MPGPAQVTCAKTDRTLSGGRLLPLFHAIVRLAQDEHADDDQARADDQADPGIRREAGDDIADEAARHDQGRVRKLRRNMAQVIALRASR